MPDDNHPTLQGKAGVRKQTWLSTLHVLLGLPKTTMRHKLLASDDFYQERVS